MHEKCPNMEFFLIRKYGPEKTPYLDTSRSELLTKLKMRFLRANKKTLLRGYDCIIYKITRSCFIIS